MKARVSLDVDARVAHARRASGVSLWRPYGPARRISEVIAHGYSYDT